VALTRLWFLRASASAFALLLSSTASSSFFCSTFYRTQKQQTALKKKKTEEEEAYQEVEREKGRRTRLVSVHQPDSPSPKIIRILAYSLT